jgi:transcriptional regulator with XRE-family HTH domain
LSSSKPGAFPGVEGDLQRTVGRNLRAHRQARGLSQEAFADVLGVHRTYMGAIERGERNLTLKSVERIVGRLDLDPLVLLAESVETADRKPLDQPLRNLESNA